MKRVILAAAVSMCFGLRPCGRPNLRRRPRRRGRRRGGSVAALSAVEGGLKTVLLEKNAFAGGAGNFMEG